MKASTTNGCRNTVHMVGYNWSILIQNMAEIVSEKKILITDNLRISKKLIFLGYLKKY